MTFFSKFNGNFFRSVDFKFEQQGEIEESCSKGSVLVLEGLNI